MGDENQGVILVTGGAGRLARAIRGAGGARVHAPTRAELDISDETAVRRTIDAVRPVAVINPALVNGVDRIEADPESARPANAVGPGVLARACAEAGLPFIHISTDYVFGGAPAERTLREDDPVLPVNAYGAMKVEGEARVREAGGRTCIARVAWLFGDDRCFVHEMLNLGRRTGSITVAADQVGTPTPIHQAGAHLVELADLMGAGDPRVPPILHLAGASPVSRADWIQVAVDAYAATGRTPPELIRSTRTGVPMAAPRPAFSAMDCSLAERLFGWRMDWAPVTYAIGATA